MELLPQLVNSAVVVLVGLLVTYVVRDRARQQDKLILAHLSALGAQIAALRDVMDVRFVAVDKRFDAINQQFASVRADMTQVALAVGAQPRPQAG